MIDFLYPDSTGYRVVQALHIIAVIFWMAGMLYLPRLFVYHTNATPEGELEKALLIQERNLLRIILNPSLIAVWVFALVMVASNSSLWTSGWFHAKLLLVILISGAHGFYAANARKFAKGERPRSEKFWRLMNEVPAVGAVLVVLLAVIKPF